MRLDAGRTCRSSSSALRRGAASCWLAFALLSSLLVSSPPVVAHELGALQVDLGLSEDGSLSVVLDVDAEHLPPGLVGLDVPWQQWGRVAAERFVEGSLITVNDVPVTLERVSEVANEPQDSPNWRVELRAILPAGTEQVAYRQTVESGQYLVTSPAAEGELPLRWGEGAGPEVEVAIVAAGVGPARSVVGQYLSLGFTHILPKGLDHILFVLGLFLLAPRMRPLLVQVSCFTVAHTITLGLAMAGWVSISPRLVEPLIALSIAYIAFENVATKNLTPWRPFIVFGFGLLHGLGFAGVLTDLGVPQGQLLPALLAFNVGVEGGQLAVIGLALVCLSLPFGAKAWYRGRVALPASLAIGLVGLFWTVERVGLPLT